MQRHLFLIISLVVVTQLPGAAYAAGNVLLPTSESSSSSSLPNLGISAPSAPAPSSAPLPITDNAAPPPPPVAAPQTSAPTPAAVLTQTSGTSSAATPTQTPVPAPAPAPLNLSTTISPIDTASAANLPSATIPTQVVHQPDMSNLVAQMNKGAANALTISISGRSIFGAKDITAINTKLGLSASQIPANCILTTRGMIQTDKGAYFVYGPPSPQVSVHYDGIITLYLITGHALCKAGQLPPGVGLIQETGNRYDVELQPIVCPAPNRQVSQLTVTYDGSGTSQCTYQ